MFYQKIVRPLVWGEPGDEARVGKALERGHPGALDYLESELPADGFLFGEIGAADIALASFFRNAAYAGFEPDAGRWPRTAAFVERTLDHPASRPCCRSRTCSAASRSGTGARRCSTPEPRSPPKPSAVREPRKGMMRL